MGSDYGYIITLLPLPKGSDNLLVSHHFPAVLVCSEWYHPFHQGHGSLMGATHLTDQCNKAFVVQQILDFAAREMCIDER